MESKYRKDKKFLFEERKYSEDSTEEEIQAIKDNVFIYDPQIIYLDEIPVVSPFSINLVFDEITLLGETLGKHGLVIDIRGTRIPDAVTRRVINQRFGRVCETISHVAFCTGKNVIINTAARFVMYQTNLESFSINKTVEECFAAIKEVVND